MSYIPPYHTLEPVTFDEAKLLFPKAFEPIESELAYFSLYAVDEQHRLWLYDDYTVKMDEPIHASVYDPERGWLNLYSDAFQQHMDQNAAQEDPPPDAFDPPNV